MARWGSTYGTLRGVAAAPAVKTSKVHNTALQRIDRFPVTRKPEVTKTLLIDNCVQNVLTPDASTYVGKVAPRLLFILVRLIEKALQLKIASRLRVRDVRSCYYFSACAESPAG